MRGGEGWSKKLHLHPPFLSLLLFTLLLRPGFAQLGSVVGQLHPHTG
jgi:hypothetical protein